MPTFPASIQPTPSFVYNSLTTPPFEFIDIWMTLFFFLLYNRPLTILSYQTLKITFLGLSFPFDFIYPSFFNELFI